MTDETREKCRFTSLAATMCALFFCSTGQAASLNFISVTDPNAATDTPPFIQLLGINNAGTIVGYTGMATPNPNRGIILTLPNSFTSLNPNINPTTCTTCQVQVFGINSAGNTTAGFFTDAGGITHGFLDAGNGPTPHLQRTINFLAWIRTGMRRPAFIPMQPALLTATLTRFQGALLHRFPLALQTDRWPVRTAWPRA